MLRNVIVLLIVQEFVLLLHFISCASITTCYGESFFISCSEDNFILVNFAAFGHFGTSNTCNIQSRTKCWIDSTYFISAICTGHHTCQSKVQYSHDLSSRLLRNKCAVVSSDTSAAPTLFVQYSCLRSTLLSSIHDVKGLDVEHAGGYLATHDYQLSIRTPEWRTSLPEEYCSKLDLPSVISVPTPLEGLGVVLKLRDIGELYRPLSASEEDSELPTANLHYPQKPASKGSLLPSLPSFHCPSGSIGDPCLSDYLRVDVTSNQRRSLRLEICPYANSIEGIPSNDVHFAQRQLEEESYYAMASAVPNSPPLVLGPVHNFTSIDFEVNLQLGGALHHPIGGNASSMVRHGWIKGLLFEYILLHCPPLPSHLEGGGHLGYALHTHSDATGATVAVAEAHCPPDRFLFPPPGFAVNTTAYNNGSNLDPLPNHLVLQCNHHTREWTPDLPSGGCMTREEIDAALTEMVNSKTATTTTTTHRVPEVIQTTTKVTTTESSNKSAANVMAAAMIKTSNMKPGSSALHSPISGTVTEENISGIGEGASLSHGSSAAMGAIFGFILCLLILISIVFIFRQRLSRFFRSKLVTSNTLPGRFPGSGMFMNTLSGSLTFSRHHKNPYFSPSHHPSVLMSQSAVSISHHPQQWGYASNPNAVKPTCTTVSLGNLHTSKHRLPPLPPPPLPPTPAGAINDLELAISETYALQQQQHNNPEQQHRPPSSVITPNSASLSMRRQTLLSADTVTTNVSGGQPSPSIATGYRGASADGLVEGFSEPPDDNQVFSATLPWKSKPQSGVTGGLKRLSTFIRSAMSGSSVSFHSHHGNHNHQQTTVTPGSTRRQQFATAWPSTSFASSSASGASAAHSMGVLSPAQSRSSYASETTIHPISSPLGSLGRSGLGQISEDRKAQICLVDSSICRLNHQSRDATTPTPINTVVATSGVGMRRGVRETTPLPPLPPHPSHNNSTNNNQKHQLTQNLSNTLSGTQSKTKTGTLNMDTYLEPIDGVHSLSRSSANPGGEDLSATELISGGTFSEDSDTGHQASWQSFSTGNGGITNAPGKAEAAIRDNSGDGGVNCNTTLPVAPIAVSDPTISLADASFEDDSSAADYFTYDEDHRLHGRQRDRVIRRPRLSPASPRSRPLSEAMLSNHYYDKSELLGPLGINVKEGETGGPQFDFPLGPNSRPTSVGVYSNEDEEEGVEEVDADEGSSLYEAVDRRRLKAGQVGALPPPQAPASPPAPQNVAEIYTSCRSTNFPGDAARYRQTRDATKAASINASTSTLIADLSPLTRSSLLHSPSPTNSPATNACQTAPYANLSKL